MCCVVKWQLPGGCSHKRIFLLSTNSDWLMGLPTGYWVHTMEVKWSRSEPDYSSSFSGKVRNVWCCIFTVMCSWHGAELTHWSLVYSAKDGNFNGCMLPCML